MFLFILCILVGLIAHHFAVFLIGYFAVTYEQFEDFVSATLNFTYIGSALVPAFYLIFGTSSVLLTTFATVLFYTMTRVDFEATHEIMQQED